eukprot:gnl/Dysnectes_brevis/373_a415_7255.p1 GENE.gnl/Dysnectes_brevis/373_a415_7255~~gnl/Dysnectes_brevis/373_a415_7255.p1  ORF type:complete len:281 (-),score=79.71 gnl/Dysnectes_brevis/373_a415_7255:45-887(-)
MQRYPLPFVPETLHEAIPNRCSWRRFVETHLTAEEVAPLVAFAEQLSGVSEHIRIRVIEVPHGSKTTRSILPVFNMKKANVSHMAIITANQDAPRPIADLLVGFLGELFILQATAHDIQNVWIGAISILFKKEAIHQLASEQEQPIAGNESVVCLVPLGHAVKPTVALRKRKEIADIVQGDVTGHPHEESLRRVFTAYQRSPSAINQQPWMLTVSADESSPLTLSLTLNGKKKDKTKEGKFLTKWLDLGIAASHVYLQLKHELPAADWGFTEHGAEFIVQ